MNPPLPSEFVAAVTTAEGRWLGTAFFIGPTTALTAAHVIKSPNSPDRAADPDETSFLDRDHIRLLPVAGPALLSVEEVRVSARYDLARLELAEPVPAWGSLQGTWEIGARVVSHGFSLKYPEARFPYGHPMDVTEVSGETSISWPGGETTALRLGPSNADEGFSGGPVVDVATGAVIGVLRFRAPQEGGTYAVPVGTVLGVWPDLELGSDGSAPGAEVSQYPRSWLAFDPARLHMVVIDSETGLVESLDKLSDAVRELRTHAISSTIWTEFRRYWDERQLLRGPATRRLTDVAKPTDVRLVSMNVRDVFTTRARLAEAVRHVVEADAALFDVTAFEPGVMLLLGVRAATRRGVTITSHGSWQEGAPLDRPFNLSDLALASHAPAGSVGLDPRIELLGHRIAGGFQEMADLPRYLDLPAYDGLRYLGPRQEAWSTVPLEELVLVLCSFHERYFENWKMLRREVAEALDARGHRTGQIARLIDLRRPQLVSQALYDRIRRCSACVTDWTGWSPSTFFELGARLAVSPWGSVQIVDDQWLDDQPDDRTLDHHKDMRHIFEPLTYRGRSDPTIGARVASQLISIKQTAGTEGGHFVRSVVIDALSRVEEARPHVAVALSDDADSLHHLEQSQRNTTQVLFPELRAAKIEQESAALERRIAAWLYLEHRAGAGLLAPGDPLRRLWSQLGETLSGELYSGTDEDLALAEAIEERMNR